MSAWKAGSPRCASTRRGAEARPAQPQSWFDLLDPKLKGKITMPHPASSGTGYFHVSAWIQMFGEEKAWAFMDRLHDNIAFYVHSGRSPASWPRRASSARHLGEISAAERATRAPIEGC
jgi:iron(III) transport system substrate-binding protein